MVFRLPRVMQSRCFSIGQNRSANHWGLMQDVSSIPHTALPCKPNWLNSLIDSFLSFRSFLDFCFQPRLLDNLNKRGARDMPSGRNWVHFFRPSFGIRTPRRFKTGTRILPTLGFQQRSRTRLCCGEGFATGMKLALVMIYE